MSIRTPDLEQTAVGPADWLPGYELLGILGAGAHGQVYRARQLALDRVVAVKLVRTDRAAGPDPAARFEREAVALGKFHHPNIVPVFDYGRHGSHLFMAMELLDGEDLGSRLKRAGPLDERTAWLIARQAAAGLAHAHQHGIVHRDVKPANLFLIPAPTGAGLPPGVPMVKVTDFGLAQARPDATPPGQPATGAEVAVGTPAYMAPEQHQSRPVDHRADIYALGATVYHALVGRPPFLAKTAWEILAKKLESGPPPLPAVSPESAALVWAMLAADPAGRIASYDELIARIDALPVVRGTASPPKRRRPRERTWLAGAALSVLVVAIMWAVGHRAPRPAHAEPPARYASAGQLEPLFDGGSLERWSVLGVWSVARDDEGVGVLTGTGLLRRGFADHEHYRLTVGLDARQAAAAEIHFGVPTGARPGRRLVLRVSPAEGAVLGTRDADRGPFRAAGEAIPFPPPNWFVGRRPYLEVRVERTGGTWAAWFRGEPAGRVPDDGTPKAPEVRLVAEGGPARIDSVVLERLAPERD